MMRRKSDFGLGRSRRPRGLTFVVAAMGLAFIVLAIMQVTDVFEPNLNLPPIAGRRHSLLEAKLNKKAYNSKVRKKSHRDPERQSSKNVVRKRITDMKHVLPVEKDVMFPRQINALEKQANEAYRAGTMAFRELTQFVEGYKGDDGFMVFADELNSSSCPRSIGGEFMEMGQVSVSLPCGIEVGSVITVKARPLPNWSDQENATVQFAVELLGSVEDEGGNPPRILHFNPRLRGDFSRKTVIELNSWYRGKWGLSQRCREYRSWTWSSRVDGKVPCEGWGRGPGQDVYKTESSMRAGEFSEFPFVENRIFELDIEAGSEGYHFFVDGRPLASLRYKLGFPLNDISTISIRGDVQVNKIQARSLPASPQIMSFGKLAIPKQEYKAPSLQTADLFVGIVSASQHFTERMAIRRTWLRSHTIQTSYEVSARFFVALHTDKAINLKLMKEADYYGDMVIMPFIDHYHLLVLKTIAIVEFTMQNTRAKHIMKCDDDTYVNIDGVIERLKEVGHRYESLFMGLFNWKHGPQREGKWNVTYEEWPWKLYPPYANGPGYIISRDIGQFIISSHRNHSLGIFKMEDVSTGLWVLKFNETVVKSGRDLGVRYEDNWRFFQAGCVEGYLSAHYQSPRQMLCLWEKLNAGTAQCC